MGISIGQLIKRTREENGVSKEMLMFGIGSRQALSRIENDEALGDKLLSDVIIQRLGKSPDKLEYILSWQEYRLECIRDWLEECLYKKNKKWAERALKLYQEKAPATVLHQMCQWRYKGMIAYWIDGDRESAGKYFVSAIKTTNPAWNTENWCKHRISSMEFENIFALIRVQEELLEQGISEDFDRERENRRREHEAILIECEKYLNEYVKDREEYAKIYSKLALVKAKVLVAEMHYREALLLCRRAIEELRENSIEYMLRPLLQLAICCREQLPDETKEELGIGNYSKYFACLESLHQQFSEKWFPTDSLLHNCHSKSYHLDFEIIRAERHVHGMTQEMAAENIYENPKEITKIENKQSSPTGIRYLALMERFGLEKERRGGLVITDSYDVLELRKEISGCISRHRFREAEPLIEKLEGNVDLQYQENQRVVKCLKNVIAMEEKRSPYAELQEEMCRLLKETSAALDAGSAEYWKNKRGKKVFYRPPFRNESLLLNCICILLMKQGKKDVAMTLYNRQMLLCEKSRLRRKDCYYSYRLYLGNQAYGLGSKALAGKALKLELECGRFGSCAVDYMTYVCAIEKEEEKEAWLNRIVEVYYLSELEKRDIDKPILQTYYFKKCGRQICDIQY